MRFLHFCHERFLIVTILVGCGTTNTNVRIPTADPTVPNTLVLQADVSGRSFGSVFKDGQPVAMALSEAGPVHFVAIGQDTDGGIRAIRIFATYRRSRPGVLQNPGLLAGPSAENIVPGGPGGTVSDSLRVEHGIDALNLLGNFNDMTIEAYAEAENFSGGKSRTPVLTIPCRMFRLRLHAVALSDDDGSHAGNVTASDFGVLVTRLNRVYEGAMIRFLFDPIADFESRRSTVLNRDQGGQLSDGNALATVDPGRILLLLRWGPDDKERTGNGNAFPPTTVPAGHVIAVTHEQNYVALPDFLVLDDFRFLNLGNGSFLAHEVGHYLGLYHTFPGWNDVGTLFGGTKPTTAAAADAAVVAFVRSNGGTVFAMDGDNLADTPPDPSPVLYVAHSQDTCTQPAITISGLVGGVMKTLPFEPECRNVMSYFPTCGNDVAGPIPQKFVKQQVARMHLALMTAPRVALLGP